MANMLKRVLDALVQASRSKSRSATQRPNCSASHTSVPHAPEQQCNSDVAEGMQQPTDVQVLEEPIELLANLNEIPLPDVIDAACFRIREKENPCGVECYASRLFQELDLTVLRTIATKTALNVAHITRSESLYINFDRGALSSAEVEVVFATETVLNRLLRVLNFLEAGLDPLRISVAEEDCSDIDVYGWRAITHGVEDIMKTASEPNVRACPGTMSCTPGGEWDVRTRFASVAERLNFVVRLDYTYNVYVSQGKMWVRFISPCVSSLPHTVYDAGLGTWKELGLEERKSLLKELQARMALTLAAACFASGMLIDSCSVQVVFPGENDACTAGSVARGLAFNFNRAQFSAHCFTLARELDAKSYVGTPCAEKLAAMGCVREMNNVPAKDPCETRGKQPAFDYRPLTEPLRTLLLADTVCELEVMEDADEPSMQRVRALRDLAASDPAAAAQGLAGLVEELETACVLRELEASRPVETQFCESYTARLLLPLAIDDASTRILPAPDALYFAQDELCDMYTATEDLETALREARKLYDMAKSSTHAHVSLISALANLERFDEAIDVAKHGLRMASTRASIGILFYRLAFAYWRTGQREMALACYRMVPRGEQIWSVAHEEMHVLMSEMGCTEEPPFAWVLNTITKNGLEIPPVKQVTDRLADLAVLLVDGGFFFLAVRCINQLQTVEPSDELGVLAKSLQN